MCEVLDRIENRGIEVLILNNIEEGFGKEKIIAKLVRRFGINEAAAEAYYEKYA